MQDKIHGQSQTNSNCLASQKADNLPRCAKLHIYQISATTTAERLVVHAIRWAVQRARYMTLETIATVSNTDPVSLPPMAA